MMSKHDRAGAAFVAIAFALIGCGGDTDSDAPLLPDNYAATYQEVRSCRPSTEHMAHVRVLVSPDAVTAYTGRVEAFPVGSIVAKEEYAGSDDSCAGPIVQYTVMRKVESAAATLDWEWQKISAEHDVLASDVGRCVSCHTNCGQPPEGYDGTCTPSL